MRRRATGLHPTTCSALNAPRSKSPESVVMDTEAPVLIIEAKDNPLGEQVRSLWVYRELLYFLAWRDFKVRYKQTVLGAAWAVIQPFFTMVVFSIFFGYLGKIA